MVNVNLIGRLGRDAEVHQSKSGGQFVSMNVASDEYNPETKQNETVWFRVTDGSERTLNMLQYLKKGTMLNIVGAERVSLFNGQNGTVINRDIRAFNWDFVRSGRTDGETTATTSQSAPTPTASATPTVTTTVNAVAASTGTFVQPTVAAQAAPASVDDLPF